MQNNNWKSQDQNTLKFNPNELETSRKYIWDTKNHKRLMEFISAQNNTNILDVGCGTGYIIRQIANEVSGSKLFGLDIAKELLEFAEKISKEEGKEISFIQGNIYSLPFPDNYFDLVTGQFVLLNIEKPENAIEEIYRVLKPGGKFVSIEPPTNTRIIYDPSIPEDILEIEHTITSSVTKQCSDKGVDKNIGLRIPEMLNKHGFKDIDIEGYFNIKLGSYPYNDEGIIERAISLLEMLKRQERRTSELVSEGKMSEQDMNRYLTFHKNKRSSVIENPKLAYNDMSIHGSLCTMICGFK